ncbi:MAG: hypothetical protein FJ288_12540 [Planctomycetes bacterium]|nr:hypothetical protein [Planctomycetota bacterium]
MGDRSRLAAGLAGLVGLAALVGAAASPAGADWPMAGHDPQRSSWAAEEQMPPATQPLWHRVIGPFIPSRSHLVTAAGSGARRTWSMWRARAAFTG